MTFCLAVELAPFGVRFTIISPGGYNTAVGGNLWEPDAVTDEPHYRETAAGALASWWRHVEHRDPIEVSEAIVDALHAEDPPIRRFVGSDVEPAVAAFRALSDDERVARSVAAGARRANTDVSDQEGY
jgi:NAD(P)-dependent dehydrogenase (short-subunit alcohol dehydrogenase family)